MEQSFRGAARYTFFRLSELLLNASELERSGLSGYIHQVHLLSPEEGGFHWAPFNNVISALPSDSSPDRELH